MQAGNPRYDTCTEAIPYPKDNFLFFLITRTYNIHSFPYLKFKTEDKPKSVLHSLRL